jgi:multidrug efflux pump subunit AcrA (membrane-fusion protein)
MRKKITLILIGLVAVGMAACGKKEETAPEKIRTVRGPKVEAVQTSPVEEVYEAVGTVRSKVASVLSSRVTGQILAVHVREGDRVQADQIMVEIDNREAATQLQKAQAGVREAQEMLEEAGRNIQAAESAKMAAEANKTLAISTFKRYKTLLERRSVSPQEFEEVQARHQAAIAEADRAEEIHRALRAKKEQVLAKMEQAKAEVNQAQLAVGYAQITSPIDGLVTAKQAEVGALATPGLPLATVEDDTHYRLEAVVEESQIGKIHAGATVRVGIDALGPMEWLGRVVEVGPATDPASRSSIVKVDLPQQADRARGRQILRSGLFGKALFSIGQRQALTVPEKAVMVRGQLQEIYVLDSENIARLRLIKTGKPYSQRVEILAGLREGERIVVEGVEAVSDGSRVE